VPEARIELALPLGKTDFESGLYALVMRSRKPDAKKFRKWVTGEVQGNLAAG